MNKLRTEFLNLILQKLKDIDINEFNDFSKFLKNGFFPK